MTRLFLLFCICNSAYGQSFSLLDPPKNIESVPIIRPKIDFSLIEKETEIENHKILKIDSKDGKTVLLVPSTGINFSIDDFHTTESLNINDIPLPKISQLKNAAKKLETFSYNDAYNQTMQNLKPLIVFVVGSDKHNKNIDEYIKVLTDLEFSKYFNLAVVNEDDKNYDSLMQGDYTLQVVVWRYLNDKWDYRVYFGVMETNKLFNKIKDAIIEYKSNNADISRILFDD